MKREREREKKGRKRRKKIRDVGDPRANPIGKI